MSDLKLAPSVLAADFTRLGEQVKEAEEGGADLLHVDVMDGRFVPPVNLGLLIVEAINRATELFLDVHLMVEEPDHLLQPFVESGADSITVHYEATDHIHRLAQDIRKLGARAGAGLNPGTPTAMLDDVMSEIDLALVMTVNPGWGGQPFLDHCLSKVRYLRRRADESNPGLQIEVDGGVGLENIGRCVAAGADVLVAGTSVFRTEAGVGASIAALKRAMSTQGAS